MNYKVDMKTIWRQGNIYTSCAMC